MGHLKDVQDGTLQPDFAQELVDALWLKYSEWVWTISANTADYFAGYNQFQNLTVGGKTHQPGLSVRVQADCPREFMDAVTHLVSTGTAFRVGAAGRAGIRDKGHFL